MPPVLPAIAGTLIHTERKKKMKPEETVQQLPATYTHIESGVDWITLTCRADDPQLRTFYRTAHQALAVQKQVTKEEVKTYTNHGYRGWRISGLAWGMREDSEIIVASGPMANVYWRLFHKYSTNVSRLDLQTTVLLERPDPDLVERYWEDRRYDQKPRYTVIQNSKGGSTFYVGSRSSDQFGRVYDKGVESGRGNIWPGKLYRYEVEYKGTRARVMTNNIFVQACRRTKLAPLILATVHDWFAERRVQPIFTRVPNDTPITVSLSARDESVERTLNWLQQQVKPAVARCLKHHEQDTLTALGLEHLFYRWEVL